jgi:TolB protein
LTPITHDFYINTEPAWSPDGKSLLYTSNRSGGLPQIYQVNLATYATTRISFDGDYNARASYTRDGKSIAMIHRVSGVYNIALLNLDSGVVRVLNSTVGDSSSPSVAPNGTMILYDTFYNGRNVLGMVSSDGRVQLRMPSRQGDAQDPAWSPFLS